MKTLKASSITVGMTLVHPLGYPFRVAEINTNPYYGWIGFTSEITHNFYGWHRPDDLVAVKE